jgi:MoaA/NifB/PqqE/SkfB family radical SAM enzyme
MGPQIGHPTRGNKIAKGNREIFGDGLTRPISGFYPVETDNLGAFCWSKPQFALSIAASHKFIEFHACRPDAAVELRCISNGKEFSSIRLVRGWGRYDIRLSAQPVNLIEFSVKPAFRAPGDTRDLGLRLRSIQPHSDFRRHEMTARRMANAALNAEEYEAGATILKSLPPLLRITMEVTCNIANKTPCVYCSWNWAKKHEAGAPAFSREHISEFGDFLDLAQEVNDSSYGEPPLHREFAEIAELLSSNGRVSSLASNGQTLGPRIREAMLGRRIHLYVSIDSVTALGYGRYRNHRFDQIIHNLQRLCLEKKAHDCLPRVTVSFIVMQSNKSEIPAFLARMKEVGVDGVFLRALWSEGSVDVERRGEAKFDAAAESVELSELEQIGAEALRLSENIGLCTSIEWEEFCADQTHSPGGDSPIPICSEPWRTIYALNRGIFPCCYGRKAFASWAERGERNIPEFLRDVFNGASYQELRSELAAGRLSSYCLGTPNCPIVRRLNALQRPKDVPPISDANSSTA